MSDLLKGRIALVTGGESGIGAACAVALGAAGASVAIIYHADANAAGAVCNTIAAAGGNAMIVQTDVGDEALVSHAFAAVTARLGTPDLLVNSAGLNMSGIPVADMELKQWDELIRTDLTGSFLTSRALVRGLRDAGKPGRIVNISSIHGTAVRYGGADYCSAKAGLDNLTRTMAIECAPLRITVNAIAPGMILTPMNQRAETDAAYRDSLTRNIPAGRAGTPEEVAGLAVYLCTDGAAYITGAIVKIDGGLSLEQALGPDAVARIDFNVEDITRIAVTGPEALTSRDLMSPYVWKAKDGRYQMLVRAVPRRGDSGDTGTIWHTASDDGISFAATSEAPAIAPGPDALDVGGCEDPTVVECADGGLIVYYTGVDASRAHGEMLYATGPSVDALVKKGVAMASTPSEGNVKEATVDRTKAGGWRMFYEYAANEASLVGLAVGESDAGPWAHEHQPFAPRPDNWDTWHLSTGPLLTSDKDAPVMFYNGATHDARWRIGWIAFDAEYGQVIDRCVEPLIAPPPAPDRTDTDIVFAASIVLTGGHPWLYYSSADATLFRATIRRS